MFYDEEIGLYYLRSRYYPPIFCRFINMDSVLLKGLLSSNLQAYCCNNPVLYSDSNGRNIFEDVWNGLCSFGQLLSDAFSESQRIKMENDQAELEAWKTVGKAIGNAASTAWNWYVDLIMENQRIQMLNAHLQYEGLKAIGSWFSNGFNALCTALLDGFKAQQQADIVSIQQQFTATNRIVDWFVSNWENVVEWAQIGYSAVTLSAGILARFGVITIAPSVEITIFIIDGILLFYDIGDTLK